MTKLGLGELNDLDDVKQALRDIETFLDTQIPDDAPTGNAQILMRNSAGQLRQYTLQTGGGNTITITDETRIVSIAVTDIEYDVKDYGATGNGVSDDSSAVIAAKDAAVAAGGGVVRFPQGTYKLSADVLFPATVTVLVDRGAILSIDAAKYLTFDGPVVSYNPWPLAGAGTRRVNSAPGAYLSNLRLSVNPAADPLAANAVERGITWVGVNNNADIIRYGGVTARINSPTPGAEKGEVWFWVMDSGTFIPVGRFDNDGRLIISPSGGLGRTGSTANALAVLMRGDSGDEVQLELENIFAAAAGNRSQAYFTALDSVGNEQVYGILRVETTNVTHGAEEAIAYLMVTKSGSVGRSYFAFDSGGSFYNHRRLVVDKDANYTVDESSDSGKTFTNRTASGSIIFTLPAIVSSGITRNIGFEVTITVAAGLQVDIDPNGAELIYPTPGVAGNKLRNAGSLGESVTLVARIGGWATVALVGTWVDGGA